MMSRAGVRGGFALVLSVLATWAPGVGADVSKAECVDANTKAQELRRDGKFSAARDQLHRCADTGCPSIVRDDCAKRLDEIDRVQPTVVFEVKDAAGKDLTAVAVAMDGRRIAESLNGTALPIDTGAHTFTFEVAGQAPVRQQLVLREGEKGRTERVTIGETGPAGGSVAAAVASKEGRTEPGTGSTQRTIGLLAGGVGVAGLIVGGVFGALTISAHSSYEQNCGSSIMVPAGYCNAAGVSGESDAANKGTLSTVFFAAGGVLAAAGAVLFLTAPTDHGPQVGVAPSGLYLRGAW